jgi:hypothetical protein
MSSTIGTGKKRRRTTSLTKVPSRRKKTPDVPKSRLPKPLVSKRKRRKIDAPMPEMSEIKVLTAPTAPTATLVSVDYREVLKVLRSAAEKAHLAAYPRLLQRSIKLGFDEMAVLMALTYIREHAPLVIHFQPTLLSMFTKVERYMNGYEIGRYSTVRNERCPRFMAESRVLQTLYDCAKPEDRVKYGALNISGDPEGATRAHSYGSAYLLLKPHMRSRITITPADSFGCMANQLATPENYAHVLCDSLTTDADLKQALSISTVLNHPQASVEDTYREIQIHGPLLFKHDIDAVVIPHSLITPQVVTDAQAFAKTHHIALILI